MKPAPFELARPATLAEAARRLREGDGMARAMAGGQSLVPMLNLRLAPVDCIVDLGRIAELREVRAEAGSVTFGACVTHAAIEDGLAHDPTGGLMRRIAGGIAYRAVRNRGTLGGSLALSDPSAEWVSLMMALDATIGIAGVDGEREVPAREFTLGAYTTALAEDEILATVRVPVLGPDARHGSFKMCRKTGEFAQSLAMAVSDPGLHYARVVVGATEGAPVVMERAAEAMRRAGGQAWSAAAEERVREAAAADLAGAGLDQDAFAADMHAASAVAAIREAVRR